MQPGRLFFCVLVASCWLERACDAEMVGVSPALSIVQPGEKVSVFFTLEDSETPLLGYSLDITTQADAGAMGAISANTMLTNFFPSRNLIVAGGGSLDPIFSVVNTSAMSGVFVNAFSEGLTTFAATPNVNDVLAQVVFEVPLNALGDFHFVLGPASALSDGNASAVAYTFSGGTIRVIPEPLSLGLLSAVAGTALLHRSRRLA